MIDARKKRALEKAGFRVGDAADFLNLDEAELKLVELRVAISREVRRLRTQLHLTQQQLAERMRSSQSRVAKLEAAANDVSLDLLLGGLFALGGGVRLVIKSSRGKSPSKKAGDRNSMAKRRAVAG